MNNYEGLLKKSDDYGLTVKEKDLNATDGLIYGNRIALRKGMNSSRRACVLAEEIRHHVTSAGNILDQDDTMNRKQELRARMYAYDTLIGLSGIVAASMAGCRNAYEISEYLGVTESFLNDALRAYTNKYGLGAAYNNYWIVFSPLQVYEFKEVFSAIKNL